MEGPGNPTHRHSFKLKAAISAYRATLQPPVYRGVGKQVTFMERKKSDTGAAILGAIEHGGEVPYVAYKDYCIGLVDARSALAAAKAARAAYETALRASEEQNRNEEAGGLRKRQTGLRGRFWSGAIGGLELTDESLSPGSEMVGAFGLSSNNPHKVINRAVKHIRIHVALTPAQSQF